MQPTRNKISSFLALLCLSLSGTAFGWHDQTHLMVAKVAGYEKWYNTTGADMIKTKADDLEKYNHWFNNNVNDKVTDAMVFDQVKRYNAPCDIEGHLYGAILHALRDYRAAKAEGKYGDYHLALAAHYIGDLSNPLHNTPNDSFNSSGDRHSRNDGIVENEVWNNGEKEARKKGKKEACMNVEKIEKNMYEISLNPDAYECSLAEEIAKIANTSRELGLTMRRENRDMTNSEAYRQLGQSASLLKAVLKSVGALSDHATRCCY